MRQRESTAVRFTARERSRVSPGDLGDAFRMDGNTPRIRRIRVGVSRGKVAVGNKGGGQVSQGARTVWIRFMIDRPPAPVDASVGTESKRENGRLYSIHPQRAAIGKMTRRGDRKD
ncbi:hypothetical protein G3N57_12785 [Paraburkholderia sp. Se-20369]|nr:hypothetical protein [Paraburkholderia sp. Se-20369]